MVDDWDDTVAALPGTIDNTSVPRRAYLIVIRGNNVGVTYAVGPNMVIGRGAGVDLQLNDEGVSRFHCRIRCEANNVFIEDLGSRNGTFCNGEPVGTSMRTLAEGDRLQIGTTSMLRLTFAEPTARPTPVPEEQGIHDHLTGAHSRHYFIESLEQAVAVARADKTSLSLLLIHVDRFASMCENRSQLFADEITIGAFSHVQAHVRNRDLVARIAIGQFAVMMQTSPGDTFMQAERLRASGAQLTVSTSEGPQQLSFSIGAAAIGEIPVENARDFLLAAGGALNRARSLGGNRVVLSSRELLQQPKSHVKV